jgi:dipeptidyl-peptidase 4
MARTPPACFLTTSFALCLIGAACREPAMPSREHMGDNSIQTSFLVATASSTSAATSAPGFRRPPSRDLESKIKALAETRNYRLGQPQSPTLSPDGKTVYFLRAKGRTPVQRLFALNLDSREEAEVVAPESLGTDAGDAALSPEEKARRERLRVSTRGFSQFLLSPDGRFLLVQLAGTSYLVTTRPESSTNKAIELPLPKGAFDPQFSPLGTHLGFVDKHNVHVLALPSSELPLVEYRKRVTKEKPQALTKDGTEEKPWGTADFLSQEELGRSRGYFFSPDDKELLVQRTDNSGVEKITIADPTSPESEPSRQHYPRVGKANPRIEFLRIPINKQGQARSLAGFDATYVSDVIWQPGRAPCLVELNRAQTSMTLACYPKDSSKHKLAEYTDKAWVNAESPAVTGSNFEWLINGEVTRGLLPFDEKTPPDAQRTLHAQERGDAWRHRTLIAIDNPSNGTGIMYLHEARDGLHQVLRKIPQGVPGESAARPPREDTLEIPNGSVDARVFPKVGLALVHETRIDRDPVWTVRSLGQGFPVIATLRSEVETHELPKVELLTLDAEGMQAALIFPEYAREHAFEGEGGPLILDAAYGGPHVNVVTTNALAYARAQWMANATGAVVALIDGRGTPKRGRDWERAIHRDFGLVVRDHERALTEIAARLKKRAYFTASLDGKESAVNFGIYGWSFGGYLAARAAIERPSFFRSAFVGAPPADFRDYDTCYTERYLGYPVDASVYDANDLTKLAFHAKERPAPIFLAHGLTDDNVIPGNGFKLADALFRAGSPVEFWPLPKTTHMLVEPDSTAKVWLAAAKFLGAGRPRTP